MSHYVRTIEDLRHRGGKSSGYGRDLRNDIYWAVEYKQEVPLEIGEFLFPANDAMRDRHREVCTMMGLQTRGYRYANWRDIRPYNPHYTGFMDVGGLKSGYGEVWDVIVKSFAPVAVFDKHYDELGALPQPLLDAQDTIIRPGQLALLECSQYTLGEIGDAVGVPCSAELEANNTASQSARTIEENACWSNVYGLGSPPNGPCIHRLT